MRAWVDGDVVGMMVLMKRARSVVDAVRGGEEAMIVGLSRLVVAGGVRVAFPTLFLQDCLALRLESRRMVGAGLSGDLQADVYRFAAMRCRLVASPDIGSRGCSAGSSAMAARGRRNFPNGDYAVDQLDAGSTLVTWDACL